MNRFGNGNGRSRPNGMGNRRRYAQGGPVAPQGMGQARPPMAPGAPNMGAGAMGPRPPMAGAGGPSRGGQMQNPRMQSMPKNRGPNGERPVPRQFSAEDVRRMVREELARRKDPGTPSPEKQRDMKRRMSEKEMDRKMQEAASKRRAPNYARGGKVTGKSCGKPMARKSGYKTGGMAKRSSCNTGRKKR